MNQMPIGCVKRYSSTRKRKCWSAGCGGLWNGLKTGYGRGRMVILRERPKHERIGLEWHVHPASKERSPGIPDAPQPSERNTVKIWKNLRQRTAVAALAAVALAGLGTKAAEASQLSGDARASIPKDVQQIIVVDYKAMQNSPAAMQLKDRVLPPELKRLETALKTSGLKVDQDCETLAFAAFRAGSGTRIIGVAQGQFQNQSIMANFAKQKVK